MFRLLLAALVLSTSAHATDAPSTHGMLVFGHGQIYLSHLPMFHRPHDYQVLLEAEFSGGAGDLFLRDSAAHPEIKIYTIVPELMVLPDVVRGKTSFKADLVRGHFERGGVTIASDVTVRITKVIYFHKFDPAAQRPARLTYLKFGRGEDIWLAHLITQRPDFDQIAPAPGGSTAPLGTTELVGFPKTAADQPLPGLDTQYLEFDDLK